MSFNPLISLARNAKRQRMEMQCDPQWVLDLAAERDQLRAELEAIMGKGVLYVSAESLADDGVVGMHATRKPNAVQNVALYALPPQQPDAWPTLDKPAKVGAVLFNPGLSARLVVEAAQRQHEYSQQPEVEAARLERFQSAMREFHGEPDDAVSVPSDTALRRAAKFLAGIDSGCNEVKTLRALVENAQGIGAVSVPREELEALRRDKQLLDAIQDGCWDVRYNSSPITDTGDYDTGVEVIGHFMQAPHERILGEDFGADVRKAIAQAMTAEAYPPARPEYDKWGRPLRAILSTKNAEEGE